MLGSTLLRQPLAEATKSDASSLLDHGLGILETSLDDGPELSDVRSNELGATLKGEGEAKKSARSFDEYCTMIEEGKRLTSTVTPRAMRAAFLAEGSSEAMSVWMCR